MKSGPPVVLRGGTCLDPRTAFRRPLFFEAALDSLLSAKEVRRDRTGKVYSLTAPLSD